MFFLRSFIKPFRLNDFPFDDFPHSFSEEVEGRGFHPERLQPSTKRLLDSLPRIAVDSTADELSDADQIVRSLQSGEWGDGKIFIFPIERFEEF